jgi:hypothetical protein
LRWLASWEIPVREKLGREASDAALAEGASLSPAEAIPMVIDWLTKAE